MKTWRNRGLIAVAAATLLACAGCASRSATELPPLSTTAKIDLPRYMGAWHVIANIPYFGEKGALASSDVYSLTSEGKIATTFHYRKAFDAPEKTIDSVGEVVAGSDNAHWIVRFFKIFSTDYLILDIAPDYSWALIGQPNRKLGWVFAREATMDDAQYAGLLEKFRGFGYDTQAFRRVPQTPDQLGKPGFQ